MLDRRRFLTVLGASGAALVSGQAFAQAALPKIVVSKDPTCGCCTGWVDHLRQAGFVAEVIETPEINRVKVRLVPAETIKRLLAEKPAGKGLAVAGMPMGSPGMEMEGMTPGTYEVVLFGPSSRQTFARYEGGRPL
jgi:hypothetical protein